MEEIVKLRAEYRRKYGTEHPKSCEDAITTTCRCRCKGSLHGVGKNLDLRRWLYG